MHNFGQFSIVPRHRVGKKWTLEYQINIDCTASPLEFGYIQKVLAPMEFLKFQDMESERLIRIPPAYTSMLPHVLAKLAGYEIRTTPHGAFDSGPDDMEVDGYATDEDSDERVEVEDGEEGEGEEEAEDDDETMGMNFDGAREG